MSKMLLSIPDNLAKQFKAIVPARQRSQFLSHLLEQELKKQEENLYECAQMVEKDLTLQEDMQAWDTTLEDGLENLDWEEKE